MKNELEIDSKLLEQARRLAPGVSVENIVAEALRYWVSKRSAEELRQLRGKLHWDEDLDAMRGAARSINGRAKYEEFNPSATGAD